MRLFHTPRTRSTRALWTLEEIGAPYELTILTTEERRGDEHRLRHPLGRVPVLELDDGQMLFESAAICLHLGDLFPAAGLSPLIGSPERPFLYQWTFFAMTEIEPTTGKWTTARREGTDETEHAERFEGLASLFERSLGDKSWLLADSFSVADIVCAKVLNTAFSRELVEGHERLRSYVERAFARPACVRAEAIGISDS